MKKLTAILLVIMLLAMSTIPAYAADHGRFNTKDEVIYQREITVTEDGGVYQVGFATIKFPAGFIGDDRLPVKIEVRIFADNGEAIIEFTPDTPEFNKSVRVNIHSYYGLLYDETLQENIMVKIKHRDLILEHFSRYAFS